VQKALPLFKDGGSIIYQYNTDMKEEVFYVHEV